MPTPQELMDMPFAGMAEKELRKHGMWDEIADIDDYEDDDIEREYVVVVTGSYISPLQEQKITVIANSIDDAFDAADDKSDFDEIEDMVIEKVKETPQ